MPISAAFCRHYRPQQKNRPPYVKLRTLLAQRELAKRKQSLDGGINVTERGDQGLQVGLPVDEAHRRQLLELRSRSSGGMFVSAVPAAIPPTMRAINSENSASLFGGGPAGVLAPAFVVVVVPPAVPLVLVVVAGGAPGIGGMPIEVIRPGAAERSCSMPCWIWRIALSACGLVTICCTSGFCIWRSSCGIMVRICSCSAGLLAISGFWAIRFAAMAGSAASASIMLRVVCELSMLDMTDGLSLICCSRLCIAGVLSSPSGVPAASVVAPPAAPVVPARAVPVPLPPALHGFGRGLRFSVPCCGLAPPPVAPPAPAVPEYGLRKVAFIIGSWISR
uniref:Uncharacterized protein n=1 Tax=Anopheles atroparvus TaxID=41427 RepID=A0A182J4Q2_ANOAO